MSRGLFDVLTQNGVIWGYYVITTITEPWRQPYTKVILSKLVV